MPSHRHTLERITRLAIYVAALLVVLTVRAPATPHSADRALRFAAAESERASEPSPVRMAITGVLLLGLVVEVAARRRQWR